MVAGLEDITAGELWIGDKLCNYVEPKNRNIAMVFQNYALFPNMTVYDNIAFGLRMRKVPSDKFKVDKDGNFKLNKDGNKIPVMRYLTKSEIDKRVKEVAETLNITEYLNRKPKALSGGQRQRVALGRAIVREPNVFLFDEPLSNLDAKLRAKMRTEITKLHKRLQTTFIYVTHDQVEAMTMGDRIVVMKGGFVQQIDTPQRLFRWPENKFVAGFIGTPQMNFVECTLTTNAKGEVVLTTKDFSTILSKEDVYRIDADYIDGDKKIIMGFRPDDVFISNDGYIKASVGLVEELGNQTLIYANTNPDELMIENSATAFCSSLVGETSVKSGDEIKFALNTAKLHFFDKETQQTIKHRIPTVTISANVANGKMTLMNSTEKLCPALLKGLTDGEYKVKVSVDALSESEEGKAGVIEEAEENGLGKTLYRVRCGNSRVFFVSENAHKIGDTVRLKVDYEKLDFYRNGELSFSAIPSSFRLDGMYVRTKILKELKHYVVADGVNFEPTFEFNQKMYDRGKVILKKVLQFELDNTDINFSQVGQKCEVEEILDYGDKRFAKLKLKTQSFIVRVADDFDQQEVRIEPNFENMRVFDKEIDMRLF
jgi:multiple sugar transport system ATP-binding protein